MNRTIPISKNLFLLGTAFIFAAACGDTDDSGKNKERLTPSEDAMAFGSCRNSMEGRANACGDVSGDGCYCDEVCVVFGDCCPDYAVECGAVACPAVEVDCGGNTPIDSDGDGCALECPACPEIAIVCGPNEVPIDSDDDSCADSCEHFCKLAASSGSGAAAPNPEEDALVAPPEPPPEECPSGTHEDYDLNTCGKICVPDQCAEDFEILCGPGQLAIDSNGDGCNDTCVGGCAPAHCEPGQIGIDNDGDGCVDECHDCIDECEPLTCPEIAGVEPVDTDGDGCPDTCQVQSCQLAILCAEGTLPVDTNGDGCPDACDGVANCLAIPTCEEGETAVLSESDCAADTLCRKVSECGDTIWCEADCDDCA